LNRKEKEQTITDLRKQVEQFKAAVLTNYRGLNVGQMNQLRQRLREEKVSFQVVKNTLMKLASKGTDLEKVSSYFEGPTAVAISYGSPISLVKSLLDFQKTLPSLEIKVGLVEGEVVPPKEMKALASMPSREVLLAQILGEIQMTGSQIGGALLSAVRQVVYAVQARADQLAGASDPTP
jgi:large subunit ribosomal protein L10